jgi:hypothetical protein
MGTSLPTGKGREDRDTGENKSALRTFGQGRGLPTITRRALMQVTVNIPEQLAEVFERGEYVISLEGPVTERESEHVK